MQTQIKQIWGNSLWLLLARISSQGLGFVFTVMVARFLGEVGLGQYSFITASIFLGNAVSSFGMDTLLIREVARKGKVDKTTVGSAIWLQLGISIIYIFFLQIVAAQLPLSTYEATTAIRVYSLALLPLAFFSVFSAVLRGAERMDLFFSISLISAIFQISLGAVLLLNGAGILEIAFLLLITHTVAALLSGWLCYRYINDFSVGWHSKKEQLIVFARRSLPFATLAVSGFLLQRLGVFSLSFLTNESETGFYSAALRIIEGSKIIHFAYLGALLPRFSSLQGDNEEKLSEALGQRSYWVLMILGISIAFAITLAAPFIIKWIYGENFSPSIMVLQLGIWMLIPYALTARKSVLLVAAGDENRVMRATLFTLLASLLIYPVLLFQFKLVGSVLALILVEVVLAYFLRRERSLRLR